MARSNISLYVAAIYCLCIGAMKLQAVTATSMTAFQFNNDFRLDVEIVDIHEEKTLFVQTYQKINGNGTIVVKKADTVHRFVVYQWLKKSYTFQERPLPGNCSSHKLSKGIPKHILSQEFLWHWEISENHESYIGPASMLRYITTLEAMIYQKKVNVSGVLCDYFEATLNGLKIGYYQSTVNQAQSGYQSGQPVRVTLDGTLPQGGWITSDSIKVNHVYNFLPIYIIPEDDRLYEYFELPVGIGCPGLNKNFTPTNYMSGYALRGQATVLTNTDDFTGETNEIVNNFDIAYISEYSYQTVSFNKFKKLKSTDTFSITEYITRSKLLKYSFMYETNYFNCSTTRNTSKTVEFELGDGHKMQWVNASRVLDFSDASYLGRKRKHNIECNVFEIVITKFGAYDDFDGGAPKAVLTLFESTSNAEMEGPEGFNYNLPIEIEIRLLKSRSNYNVDKLVQLEFNEFINLGVSDLPPYLRYFTSCPDSEDTGIYVQLTYKADSKSAKSALISPEELGTKVEDAIITTANVSPFRISRAQISLTDNGFLATSEIKDRPSAKLEFSKMSEGDIFKGGDVTVVPEVAYEEQCAKMCLQYDRDILCSHYSYCDFTCYLYHGKSTPDLVPSPDHRDTCVAKKRIDTSASVMPFVSDILGQVSMQIGDVQPPEEGTTNSMKITITKNYGRTVVIYDPVGFTTNIPENRGEGSHPLGPGPRLAKSHARLLLSDKSEKSVVVEDVLYMSSCWEYCKQEGEFFCDTFSYCIDEGTCIISSRSGLNVNDNTTDPDDDCYIYARDHLSEYMKLPGLILQDKGYKMVTAKDADSCAEACSDMTGLFFGACESFDYCDADQKCILHHKHILDVKDTSEIKHNDKCAHYSKDYMKDYLSEGKKRMTKGAISETIANMTGEMCAKECSLSSNCVGYDFCVGQIPVCSLTTLHLGDEKLTFTESLVCEHFSLIDSDSKTTIDSDSKTTISPAPTDKSNPDHDNDNDKGGKSSKETKSAKKFGSGAVAGAVIGMIAFGAAIAGIAVFVYARRQGVRY